MHNYAAKNDIEVIEKALSYIPSGDRETWVTIGMSIKSELKEEGYYYWDKWSQLANNYNEKDALNTWKSIKANGETKIGTLFHIAKQHGFSFDNLKDPDSFVHVKKLKKTDNNSDIPINSKENKETEKAEKQSLQIFNSSKSCVLHQYLSRKKINPPYYARVNTAESSECAGQFWTKGDDNKLVKLQGNLLILPLMDIKEVIRGISAIDKDGRKSYQKGIEKTGLFMPLTNWSTTPLDYEGNIYIGEGVATMATIQEVTGCLSIMATDAGNLPHVAKAIRGKFSKSKIIVASDWDCNGTGQKKAIEAAILVGGYVVFPKFTGEHTDSKKPPSDFNDVFLLYGKEAVKEQLQQIQEPHLNDEWPEPQPIIESSIIRNYPINALPDGIREAVEEVVNYVQCPPAQAACSALSAISIAAQGLVDVSRDSILSGPINLYMLIIAKSGERKTTSDSYFTAAIKRWESLQYKEMYEEIIQHKQAISAFEAARHGILEAIKQAAKNNDLQKEEKERARLTKHLKTKPEILRVPRILYDDATPEALALNIHNGWHSAGILSNEAGSIFGSHGMGKDSVTRNLSLYNKLWEGSDIKFDRKTSESCNISGARFTMCLAVQPDVIKNFLSSNDGLARGIGFAARFLFSCSPSTQGTRLYKEPPNEMKHLEQFNTRITQLLKHELITDSKTGAITTVKLSFNNEAKKVWAEFHDDVEKELQDFGELDGLNDIASKIADNAARIAAIFYMYLNYGGIDTYGDNKIDEDSMRKACAIAHWHLLEAKRFFTEVEVPVTTKIICEIDRFLIEHCVKHNVQQVSMQYFQQHAPYAIRNMKQKDFLPYLEALSEKGRIKIIAVGRGKNILINPTLLNNCKSNADA